MKLIITDAASQWFRDEMGLEPGNGVKFYGKTYGQTEVHHGFSQGFTREDKPVDPILEVKKVTDSIRKYRVRRNDRRKRL